MLKNAEIGVFHMWEIYKFMKQFWKSKQSDGAGQ